MRPAVADLDLQFEGIQVHDLAPDRLPNLYFGAPVRVYGRYSGSGEGRVTLTGHVQGREIKTSMNLPFPKSDDGNPEIERMWAQKRIDQLLKAGDRRGSRQDVLDEVVRLGEDFSIVTEYTSFLVLENDAEYQRWKIERRNQKRLQRDRAAQDSRSQVLDSMRRKAIQDIGPQAKAEAVKTMDPSARNAQAAPAVQPARPVSQSASQNTRPQAEPRRQSRDFDFGSGGGSGPVGPVFVALAMLIKRRKMRK